MIKRISKEEFESNRKRFNDDAAFRNSVYSYYARYIDVPDPEMELEVSGVGKVWLGENKFVTKRTYYYSLADGHSGDVWHNKRKFIVKDDYGNPVDKNVYETVHDLIVIGFHCEQSKLKQLTNYDIRRVKERRKNIVEQKKKKGRKNEH